MNLPNKLTVARTLLIPVFLVFLLVDVIPLHFLLAGIIFIIASLTDYLDGKIARSRNLVTTFGKFLDPLADKALVTAALVAFVELGLSTSIPVILIIVRDLMVSAMRMLASSDGEVIAANWWGKVKTALQMVSIIGILLAAQLFSGSETATEQLCFYSDIVMWILALFTVVSGLVYLYDNRKLISSAN